MRAVDPVATRPCGFTHPITLPAATPRWHTAPPDGYRQHAKSRLDPFYFYNSVITIGYSAFSYSYHLASVTIPKSVATIQDLAFFYSSELTAINVVPDNPVYSSVAGVLFDKSKTTLVAFPGGLNGSYTIPNSVTTIGFGAFGECHENIGVASCQLDKSF